MPDNNKEQTFSFKVEGMTCASCVQRVEKSLKGLAHVSYASVNLATEKAYIIGNSSLTKEQLINAVKKTGYTLSDDTHDENSIARQFSKARKNMLLSLFVTAPVMALMFAHMVGFHIPGFLYIELIAGAFSLIFIARGILKSAWIAVSHLHTNMDTLVSIGALASYMTTVLAILGLPILSFGSISMMLVALHITGKYIESKLKYRASKEIHALLSMQTKTAAVMQTDGSLVIMPVEDIPVGSELLIRSGERIPLDGTITEGKGTIDEAMISGEAVPVKKHTGATVTGGTLLNSGLIKVRVEKIGEQTFLAQMIKLVEEAQSSKVPIQAFADRLTAIFIPVVLTLAIAMSLAWFFNYASMSVLLHKLHAYLPWIHPDAGPLSTAVFVFVATLVIACPCALGLATPMALITGTGAAAKKGLIIKNGEIIQKAKDINILLLDKTGTITKGKPQVIETNLDDDNLAIIAALEKNSTHPLATAITRYAENRSLHTDLELANITEKTGSGISGRLNGQEYFCGKPTDASAYTPLMEKGHTVVEALMDGSIIGYLAISDPVKDDARAMVAKLKELGISPIMLTGDNEATARTIARQVGIDEIIAGARPDDKVREVRKHQVNNKVVAMLGDGINDAAALKSADIGIAIGTGTDLAIESGDVIIINGELLKVLDAIYISKTIFLKIKQNLFWAFIYNIIAIPLAMLGLLHPAIAEIAMTVSSLTVIANSIRIKGKIDAQSRSSRT